MKAPRYSLGPADQCYDENEAQHRFESALRGARRAHAQRMKGQLRAADEKGAGAQGKQAAPSAGE